MSNDLNLAGEPLAAAVTWFLDTFITPVVDSAKVAIARKKTEFDWGAAAESYRAHLLDLYGTVRVLGAAHDAPLDDLFTDLYILDHITARRRYPRLAAHQRTKRQTTSILCSQRIASAMPQGRGGHGPAGDSGWFVGAASGE